MNNKQVNSKIKKTVLSFQQSFKETVDPKTGQIPAASAKSFEEACAGYRAEVSAALAPVYDELNKKMVEAPSQEATNCISLLSMRAPETISQDEITALLKAHSDSPQAYEAIKGVAVSKGVISKTAARYMISKTEDRLSQVKSMQEFMDHKLTKREANTVHSASDGMVDLMCQLVDTAFPCEAITSAE